MPNNFATTPTNVKKITADDGTESAVGDTPNKAIRVNIVAGSVSVGSVNQGAPNTVTNAWPIKITDGTDIALVTAGGLLQVDGSGVTQPVSGTFFQATQPISAVSLPLPTGAATAALQTQPGVDIGDVTVNNGVGASAVNVQDGGNSLTIDNAALSVIGGGAEATALRVTIANDSTGLLPVSVSGGDLNSVSLISSVIPGTSSDRLGKAEDAASASGDTGVAILAVRRDYPTITTDTDGDYTSIIADNLGQVRVVDDKLNPLLASNRQIIYLLESIVVELRVLVNICNEGLNTTENVELAREDENHSFRKEY